MFCNLSTDLNFLFFLFFFCAALFQSLLFEACGRTVNPVNGAVGLLWTGNWHVCQAAVETVLRGGTLRPSGFDAPSDEASDTDVWRIQDPSPNFRFTSSRSNNKVSAGGGKRRRSEDHVKLPAAAAAINLDLRLTPIFLQKAPESIRRAGSPSMNSEESVTTTACLEGGIGDQWAHGGDRKVLNLFI